MHRVSIGTDSGNLTLVNTHGPVIWSQGFSIVEDPGSENSFRSRKTAFAGCTTPTAVSFNGRMAPSLSDIARREWPDAIHRALRQMKEHMESGIPNPGQSREYLLDLSGFWLEITRRIGASSTMKIPIAPAPLPEPVWYLDRLRTKQACL